MLESSQEPNTIEPASQRRQKALRPRARLLRTLGDELISSESVAILELVKNSYDADATRVLIRFTGELTIGKGCIEVIDNGHGMSLETVRGAWLEPATGHKRAQRRSEQLNRRMLGEKGIGRFAASRLADILEVSTRRAGARREVYARLDWRDFDDEDKYLDEIRVVTELRSPRAIAPGGEVAALWSAGKAGRVTKKAQSHGTLLRMTQLRTDWTEVQFEKLRLDLARLVAPFGRTLSSSVNNEFQILLEAPPPFEAEQRLIQVPEVLQHPHYLLAGTLTRTGRYRLLLTMGGQESIAARGKVPLPGNRQPECGPFALELRVWDRDQAAVAALAQSQGTTLSDIRRDLDSVAGISIYRDRFRVLPYGERGDDWLELDRRRVNNPTMRLSNNQISGYIAISSEKNPGLRDQTNREGLIAGPALEDLRAAVLAMLAELEQRRFKERPRRNELASSGLFEGFTLAPIREMVQARRPSDRELLATIRRAERDLDKRVAAVQQVLARYLGLTTVARLADRLLHDARAPLASIRNRVANGQRRLERIGPSDGMDGVSGPMRETLGKIDEQALVLKGMLDRLEPFGRRRGVQKVSTSLERAIKEAFDVLAAEIEATDTVTHLPGGETIAIVDPGELQNVIVNLLDNSLYWLRQVPKGRRSIVVEVTKHPEGGVQIIFSDSGPGVPEEFQERIFEPYFSTKPDGTGLGLTIIGDIVRGYYGGTLELLESGPLPGATFRVTLKERV